MEKKFKITKKTVLKNVEPETFITNEQWVKDNKRFAKFFIIEEIKTPIVEEQKEPEILEEKPKKVKKEKEVETEIKHEIDNEETT